MFGELNGGIYIQKPARKKETTFPKAEEHSHLNNLPEQWKNTNKPKNFL